MFKVHPSHFFAAGKISFNSGISYLQNLAPEFICIILTLPLETLEMHTEDGDVSSTARHQMGKVAFG